MKIIKFLEKLFDLTGKVESSIEIVSRKTRKTVKKIVSSLMKSIINTLVLIFSFILIIVGSIFFLSRYAPIEYVLLFIGFLGLLYLAAQKISIKVN